MHKNDLLILLQKLSQKEVKDFQIFLKRHFKADSIPMRLFQFLRNHHPVFSPNKVTYENAHNFLAPGKLFNKTLVINHLSDIRIKLREYLVEQYLKENPAQQDMILLQVYRQYQLDKHFIKKHNALNRALEKDKVMDMWFYLKKMILDHEQYSFKSTKSLNVRSSIYSVMDNLDRFYASAKLRYSSELFNGFQILDESEPDILFLSEIEESPLIQSSLYHHFYNLALKMLRDRDQSKYYQLKNDFFKNSKQISKEDQYILICYLLNYISYEVRKGKETFNEECFELFKFGFEKEIFIVPGILPPNLLLNAVEVAGHLGQAEWAKATIKKWSKKLEPTIRNYYTMLSKAILYFRIQDFESCSKILLQPDIIEPQNELRRRWLEVVVPYELKSGHNLILGRCTAFEKFVRRNTFIHQTRKKGVLLSIKILRMLLKPEPDKNRILKLIENSEDFHYKGWLTQKAKEL